MRHVTHDQDDAGTFPESRPGLVWVNSYSHCNECGEDWIATHPAGCDNLICPQCNSPDTERVLALQDDDGIHV